MVTPRQTPDDNMEPGSAPISAPGIFNMPGSPYVPGTGVILSPENQELIREANVEEEIASELGDVNDLRALFQTSPTFQNAYNQLTQQVSSLAANKYGNQSPETKNEIWNQIQFPANIFQNIPLEGGYRTTPLGAAYQYEVKSFNELVRYPYQLNPNDLQTLTNKLVYAGLLSQENMPVGVFNAADPTFDTAWRALIRRSIANNRSLSAELDYTINERLETAKQTLQETMPDQRAGMQSVAVGLLGRELSDAELDEAMNLITSRFNMTMTEEERFLTGESGAPTTAMATQAVGSIAEEEIAIQREGAGYLGLAQFNPRKNYGLSATQKQAFAGLQDNPFQTTETGMTNE